MPALTERRLILAAWELRRPGGELNFKQFAGGTPALPDSARIGKFSRIVREIFTRLG
jgi:hypothetical protein